MAGKQVAGTGLSESIAGMSKNQLYDIVSQMKTLIEQNQHQAKQILIQNPLLTKALFQAQIMLGMVRPPQIPNIQPSASQHPLPSAHTTQLSNIQATHVSSSQINVQDQTSTPQMVPPRKQYQNQPSMPVSSAAAPPTVNIQPHSGPLVPLQTPKQPKGYEMPQVNPISVPQPSQIPSVPPILPSATQPPLLHQPQIPSASMQMQQPLQTADIPHMPLQAPLPPLSRAPSGPNFHHPYPPQMGHNLNYQPAGVPQHASQPMFHSGTKHPPSFGNSFSQGKPALPSQPPPQSMYQAGGSNLGPEFMNQGGNSKPADRGPWMPGPQESSKPTDRGPWMPGPHESSKPADRGPWMPGPHESSKPADRGPWMPGLQENLKPADRGPWMSGPLETSSLPQLSGPSPVGPGSMGPSNQPPRAAPPLSAEMEKMLLQQVMSLTPEQINLLPPEQRNQVLQLQQILRQ